MKQRSRFVMLASGINGGFALTVGLLALSSPSEAAALMGEVKFVTSIMTWTYVLTGASLLVFATISLFWASSRLSNWNPLIMLFFGSIMLTVGLIDNARALLVLTILSSLMVVLGVVLQFDSVYARIFFFTVPELVCSSCDSKVRFPLHCGEPMELKEAGDSAWIVQCGNCGYEEDAPSHHGLAMIAGLPRVGAK